MAKDYELIHPRTHMRVLSQYEIQKLADVGSASYELLRRCAFAVLSAGSQEDDYTRLEEDYRKFKITVEQLSLIHISEPTRPY